VLSSAGFVILSFRPGRLPMSQNDSWYVMLGDGDVHRVTLDELDEAFQAGHVDAQTLVLAEGAKAWTRLGQLAGLDESEPAFQPGTPNGARAPLAHESQVLTSVPASFYEDRAGARPSPVSSFRPVSLDLSDVDFGEVSFRTGSGRIAKRLASVAAVLACAGSVAFVAVSRPTWAGPVVRRADQMLSRIGVHMASDKPPAQAAASPVMTPAAPPPVAAATPSDTKAADTKDAKAADKAPATQDLGLLTTPPAPPKTEAPPKAHARSHLRAIVHAVAAKVKTSGFTTSGSKYDPLNSTIGQ
jgi:GYF domain 2